jgi:hypothetical protein
MPFDLNNSPSSEKRSKREQRTFPGVSDLAGEEQVLAEKDTSIVHKFSHNSNGSVPIRWKPVLNFFQILD